MELILDTPAGSVPARVRGGGEVGVLLATGAGTGHDHPGIAGLQTALVDQGMTVMTFEYAYRAAGRSFPDRMPRLKAVHRSAADYLRARVGDRLVLAGRSMGGRVSTMLAAEGEACAGVIAFGYPLHPAGKPERLRVEHLAAVEVPTLFITGSRDPLALPHLVAEHLVPLDGATVVEIGGADHSFRAGGMTPEAMLAHLAATAARWIQSIPGLGGEDRPAP